jgi:hypothetical protein
MLAILFQTDTADALKEYITGNIFLNKIGSRTHSDPIFCKRGEVLVISMPGKKVLECCSSLCHSEKALLEQCSGKKIPLVICGEKFVGRNKVLNCHSGVRTLKIKR